MASEARKGLGEKLWGVKVKRWLLQGTVGTMRQAQATSGLLALITLTAFSLVTFFIIVGLMITSLERQARNYLEAIDRQEAEANHILDELTTIGDDHGCGAGVLAEMRKQLLTARYAAEIQYHAGERIICTSSEGVLITPVNLPEPVLILAQGLRAWLYQDFRRSDVPQGSSLVARGTFGVLFNSGLHMREAHPRPGFEWESVYLWPSSAMHVSGTPGVFRGRASEAGYRISHDGIYYQRCSDENRFCIGVKYPYTLLVTLHGVTLAALLALHLGVGLLAYYAIYQWLSRYRTLDYRVQHGVLYDHIEPAFQPIIDAESGGLSGVEVLARFKDDQGEIPCDTFLPAVERLGLGWLFTEQLARKSFVQLTSLTALPPGLRVAINVFPRDVLNGSVRKILACRPPWLMTGQLVLEVTECEDFDYEQARVHMRFLSSHGICFSLDDFGTGYANISKIKFLPFSYLKIDRSFVSDIDGSELSDSLIPQICDMATAMNLTIVAEGVETKLQVDKLRDLGIPYLQGWYFSRALDAAGLAEYLRRTLAPITLCFTERGSTDSPSAPSDSTTVRELSRNKSGTISSASLGPSG